MEFNRFSALKRYPLMSRTLFLFLGLLELAVACLLAYFAFQLPRDEMIASSFGQAERVTARSANQVALLRKQVQGFKQVQLAEVSSRLEDQTRTVTEMLRAQTVDFETVCTIRDALIGVSAGLKGLAQSLDADSIGRLSTGLGETADFLSEKVVPAAHKAADHLDASTENMRADAEHLSKLLKDSPPDFKVLKEVHTSLGHFRDGLNQMGKNLQLDRTETMRDGFRGLVSSLSAGADQVEKLSNYTYPSLSFRGVKPEVAQHSFWPEGRSIADGMRKAALGADAAALELDSMTTELPQVRKSLEESGKVIDKVREALGVALAYQNRVEPLLVEMPGQAAKLAEDLPRLGSDLSRLLRDTGRLTDVAAALRQAQKGIDQTVQNWPQTQATLTRLAGGLQETGNRLNQVVEHRQEYETAMRQTVRLAETFISLLPMMTDQLEGRLDEEDRTLVDLGQSLDEVQNALPVYAQAASRLCQAGRYLAWMVALIVGIHAAYLIAGARIHPQS
jgi:hypothetical protein